MKNKSWSNVIVLEGRKYKYNYAQNIVFYKNPLFGWRECHQMNHIDKIKSLLGANRY